MRFIGVLSCSLLLLSGRAGAGFVAIDVPGSTSTTATGISDGIVVGSYNAISKPFGLLTSGAFLYHNGTYTLLHVPGSIYTSANSISGSTIVGSYLDSSDFSHGFIYNGKTFTTLDFPGAKGTDPAGMSGSNIVGSYFDSKFVQHGFLYNGKTFSVLNFPGAIGTIPTGISGNKIIGNYLTPGSFGGLPFPILHPFLYKNGTYSSLHIPGTTLTQVSGISGNKIVGFYAKPSGSTSGFIYDGKTLTTLNASGAGFLPASYASTFPSAIDDKGEIVGVYSGPRGIEGFLYTPVSAAPEPSSLTLLILGALGVAGYGWRPQLRPDDKRSRRVVIENQARKV